MLKILSQRLCALAVLFLLGALLGLAITAPAKARQAPTPELELWAGFWSEADPSAESDVGRVALATAGFELEMPVILDRGRTILRHGPSVRSFRFDWADDGGAPDLDEVHEVAYAFSVTRVRSERWVWTARVQPVVSSDRFGEISRESFDVNAALIATRLHGPDLRTGYGLAYALQFDLPFPIPLFMLNWRGERSWVDLTLPVRMEAGLHLRPSVDFGVRMRVDGGQFALEPEDAPGEEPSLHFVDVTCGPFLGWRPSERVAFDLFGGFAAHRELRVKDGDDETADWSPDPAPTVRLSCKLGL